MQVQNCRFLPRFVQKLSLMPFNCQHLSNSVPDHLRVIFLFFCIRKTPLLYNKNTTMTVIGEFSHVTHRYEVTVRPIQTCFFICLYNKLYYVKLDVTVIR